MFYHPCTLSAVLSVCTLNSCNSHCEELILRSVHTSSLQNLSTVSGQEAMGWIMTKVLGTLSFSSHGIPSPHVFLADPGAFPQDAARYGPMAGQVPLSARQETPSLDQQAHVHHHKQMSDGVLGNTVWTRVMFVLHFNA